MKNVNLLAPLALALGFGRAWAAVPAVDFDGVLKSGDGQSIVERLQRQAERMPDVKASPVYLGSDGAWCEPGRPYHGGPCDLHGRLPPDPGDYHGPESDPYRNPNGNPPYDPNPRPAPRPVPSLPTTPPPMPDWWAWDRPEQVAGELVQAATAAYAAARARQGGWWHFNQHAAVRDLGDLVAAASRYRDQVQQDFHRDPWSTERAYQEARWAADRASGSIEHANVPTVALVAFTQANVKLKDLERYYRYRP